MDAWALISVSDKEGVEDVARSLQEQGLKLLATSSTAQYLQERGLAVQTVESLTGFGAILDGRVKTLHPVIYAGLLASSGASHQAQRIGLGAPDIRVVIVNLYPFEQRWQGEDVDTSLIEEIDIGGVSLLRAGAKNFERVAVLVSPTQYAAFLAVPWAEQDTSFRRRLARVAFEHVAYYDAVIAQALRAPDEPWPEQLVLAGRRQGSLRYGENPHQPGAFYRTVPGRGFATASIVQGKGLSYNNYADADTAVRLAYDFEQPTAVVVKHQTPCAVAVADSIDRAYVRAHEADPVSIFGGIVAVNRPVDGPLAQHLTDIFLEVVVAPAVTDEARAVLAQKKNLRVLVMPKEPIENWDLRGIWGGFLVQPHDTFKSARRKWRHVAGPESSPAVEEDLELAWKVVARAKSNAIVVAKAGVTLGIGSGQTNRIDAARQALERAGAGARGAVLASDGFFPFDDVLRLASECGVAVVIEPGGSVRDQDSIMVADAAGITLMMTDERHFRH
ncbi:MAG: bifunctional phosphoribosylaminoimidazolecarboxamide formyltransferase/IMP cyclohydrolase PurH [Sulfobacillus acidophilus]|uniref:Bifunctional purine biosynthesis protein PurH n=1 Tax=Sulfobacillus acidophilus TaxID=53633 RepID=A0A2T2WGA2_9FIRM|nr:MAG: bifunctional phosphoribosylaminoimidazolecarboxamide formyltransferase/IMP cyclohydrolase PurH [Sulfobacillus acidophilus]